MWVFLKSQLLTKLKHSDDVVLWNKRMHLWMFCKVKLNLNCLNATTLLNYKTNSDAARMCCPFDALGVGNVSRTPIEYQAYIPRAGIEMMAEEVLLRKSQNLIKTVFSSGTDS